MYPLRRKPSKLFSKVVILLIWILGTLFALPMGVVHTFGYVDDLVVAESGEAVKKPFCYIDFGPNATQTNLTLFQYYSTSLLTVQYFLPMAIISVAYARIAFRLWGTKTPGAAQDERDHNILVNKKKVKWEIMTRFCRLPHFWPTWTKIIAFLLLSLFATAIQNFFNTLLSLFIKWSQKSGICLCESFIHWMNDTLSTALQVIKMLLIVVCIFSICWLPWQVYMTTMHVYPEINE